MARRGGWFCWALFNHKATMTGQILLGHKGWMVKLLRARLVNPVAFSIFVLNGHTHGPVAVASIFNSDSFCHGDTFKKLCVSYLIVAS